jgi:predicted phosphodiesterase
MAVLSDIHGNGVALDAVLIDLRREPVDQIVCLGDAVQGGPQPAAVVARLRDLACPVVMGNADAWLLSGQETGSEPVTEERRRVLAEVRVWTLTQLSEDDCAFIARFPATVTVPLGDKRNLLCFHGSPHSFDDVILPTTPEEEGRRLLGGFEPHLLAGGHTHVQQLRHLRRSFYFGCGSVGLAYRHGQPADEFRADPWAEYALLTVDGERLGLEFRRVPFEVAALVAAYRASERPYADDAIAQYSPR